jgi:drug/metabolite transporter (DMT)-like permease
MNIPAEILGQTAALSTAIVWAFAVILFKKSGETVHPVALNIFKNIFAIVLIAPTVYLFGDTLTGNFSYGEVALLLVSGALGIGIADTLFFKSLNLLGAGLSAIVDCLYSPSIIILAFFWLGERLGMVQLVGLVMIISAVLTISRTEKKSSPGKSDLLWGIVWGAMAMFTMACGIVMIKPLLNKSPLLPLTEVRLLGGCIVLAIVLLFHPKRKTIMRPHLNTRSWTYMISGSFVGTYIALILWLAGMKFIDTSVAAALNQTSNIFIFIFAAIFLKEAITKRKLIGIFLGVVGAFIVIWGNGG